MLNERALIPLRDLVTSKRDSPNYYRPRLSCAANAKQDGRGWPNGQRFEDKPQR
jgi:hypothetical protein